MKHNNYKEVKNFIHNEEKITKEEIHELIRETVREEVRKIVTLPLIDETTKKIIENLVKQGLSESWHTTYKNRVGNTLEKEIGRQVADRLTIEIKVDE